MLNEKKILDITERIRAKQISKFRQYSIDNATESIYWVKPDASFFYVNETACNTLGYTYDELLAMTVHDINPDYQKENWDEIWTKIKKLGSYTFETHHKTRDGNIFPVEITANHVNHEGWEYNCAFVRNITDRKQTEEVLYKKKRALKVISQFNHALVHAENEQQLLDDICRIIVDTGNYKLAWIGYAEHDNDKTVRPVAQSGYEEGYIDELNITWADDKHGRGPAGTSIRKQESYVARNILTDENFKPWRDAALQRGYASATGIPLVISGETVGALIIYAPEPDAFDTEEMELLAELAENLAFGIHTLRIEAERKQTETALRNQNAVLTSLSRSTELARYDFANFIKLLTRVAGRMLKVERSSVWLFNEDRSLLCCFDLYELSKDKHNDDKVKLEAASYPNYFSALREGRAIAADNAHKNPATCEFSESYLTPYGISSMLDAPIRSGGEVVGVVCHEHVGISRQWTLEEQDFAGSIADFASLAFATREHKQLKRELKYHKQFKHYWSFEKLVASLSTNFINLTLDQLDKGINESLKAIGNFANVDRCYVFDLSSDLSNVKNMYIWRDDYFIHNNNLLPELNVDEYSWIISECLKGEFVNIPVVKEIKVDATWQQRVIKHKKIQSLLALPLILGNKVIGLLGLESVRTYRSWSKKEIMRFKIASDMFAHTLGRKHADETHSYTNRALNVLSQCNDVLMHATHEQDLLEEICRIIVDSGNYKFAWIGFNQENGDLSEPGTAIYPVAQAGYNNYGLDIMESTWMDVNSISGAMIAAIKSGKPYINHDLLAGEHYTAWNEYAISHGCKSSVTLPLVSGQDTLGVLIIYASEQDAYNESEIDLLIKLSSNLVYGIQSLRNRVEQLKTRVFSILERETNNIIGLNLSLNEQLALFNSTVEANIPGTNCSLLLLDEKKKILTYGSAESLPDDFKSIFNGLKISKSVPTCAKAAFYDRQVITADIKSDPDWSSYDEIISKYSIRACWSNPVHAPDGSLLGTFAFYFICKKNPTNEDLFLLEYLSGLAGKIIDHKQTKDAISKSDSRYQSLYNDSPMILFNIDDNGKILSINSYGAKQLGYLVSELAGENINKILFEEDYKLIKEHIKICFNQHDKVQRWELRKKKKDGDVIWSIDTARIVNESNNEQSLFIICENVTETHLLSEKLSHQQKHDSLTGLLNRKEFERQLEKKIQESCINKTEHALCYLDLDQFKVINDTCGHIAGDELIRRLSNKMQSRIRKKDTFARLGGDEFGVLIESCNLDHAMRVTNELSEVIRTFDFVWKEKRFSLGVSIGLVPIDNTCGDVISIMSAADEACYVAKEAGRNRIHVYHPDDADLSKLRGEMQWVSQITHALEENRLILNKQTIIPVNDQDEYGDHYEVLIRMKDEKGNDIPPAMFLPSAERYNLSGKLDIWVVKTTFTWLESSRGKLENLKLCSINLSCLSLVDEEVLRFILDKFNEGKIPPEKICFEITETAAITNLTSARIFISTLKDLGCMFALDDFGSGLSSFAYLRNLPVDFLKIDGKFVRNIARNPIDFAMVRSINEIGKVMGKQTIAEYVEDDEILDQLRVIGVDYAQGFSIGKPKPLH